MSKRSFSSEEIITRLKGKGMSFGDINYAKNFFNCVPYYRFRGYFLTYIDESDRCSQYGKKFNTSIKFEDIALRYYKDGVIRNILSEPINSFEVFLRAILVEILGKNSEYEYTQQNFYDQRRASRIFNRGKSNSYWDVLQEKLNISKRLCPLSVRVRHTQDVPIWAIIGHMDFGALEIILNMLKDEDLALILNKLSYNSRRLFIRHISYIRTLRNLCSHHEQLWANDMKTEYQRRGKFPSVQIPWVSEYTAHNSQLYGLVLLLLHYHKKTGTNITKIQYWLTMLVPICRGIKPNDLRDGYGFPLNWLDQSLWKDVISEI